MVKKIQTLKNFGIFKNFSWDSALPEFEKFNLIYGWNGSGKTTLSRVFRSLENASNEIQESEFVVKRESTTIKSSESLEDLQGKLKVFNKQFIEDNIFLEEQIKNFNPIVYISETDIEKKKLLESKKTELTQKIEEYDSKNLELKTAKNAEDQFRTQAARLISSHVTDKQVTDTYYSYDKRKILNKIDSLDLSTLSLLSSNQLESFKNIAKSQALKTKDILSVEPFSQLVAYGISNNENFVNFVNDLLKKDIETLTIERLKNDTDLRTFIKKGFDLYKTKKLENKCVFCNQELVNGFMDQLSKYFSKDFENIRSEITETLNKIERINFISIDSEEVNSFYPDLQNDIKDLIKSHKAIIENIEKWITNVSEKLNSKFEDPENGNIELLDSISDLEKEYKYSIESINKIIEEHNKKSKNHSTEVKKAKESIEIHYIKEETDKFDYTNKKLSIELLRSSVEDKKSDKKALKIEVNDLEKQTSTIGTAIEHINFYIKQFLGREELILSISEDNTGYIIQRNGVNAKHLSEGEKTVIAFSYFITKVTENENKIEDTIIYIDDPISSLDSNFIYHAFSLIKVHFNEAKQLFISTHNFEFFNLIKEWLTGKNKKNKPLKSAFYMISNQIEEDNRIASIIELEDTLKNFKSEYHYLFYLLNDFKNQAEAYKDFYTIGNIARRFLEVFVNFKIPDKSSTDLKSKMDQLEYENVSNTEKEELYKVVNEYSHEVDILTTIQHKDKFPSKKTIDILFKFLEENDPKHYQVLKKNIQI